MINNFGNFEFISSYVAHFVILWGFPSLELLLSNQEFAEPNIS